MLIITRYILRALAGPFIFGLAVISFIILSQFMMQEVSFLLDRDVPVNVILKFMVLNLAWVVALAVPMSVLLAVLMAFGRLSADNEITALKASGIGMHRIMIPVLIMSVFICIGMFFFNDRVLPEVNWWQRTMSTNLTRKNPKLVFTEGVFADSELIRDYNILFKEIDDASEWVYGVIIFNNANNLRHEQVIADRGTVSYKDEEGIIYLTLYDGEIHEFDAGTLEEYTRSSFKKQLFRIPFETSEFSEDAEAGRGNRSKPIWWLENDIKNQIKMINDKKDQMINRIAGFFKVEKLDDPVLEEFVHNLSEDDFIENPDYSNNGIYSNRPKNIIDNSIQSEKIDQINNNNLIVNYLYSGVIFNKQRGKTIRGFTVEIHKKFSLPVACIVFILIGMPLGVRARHGGLAIGATLSMLFFVIFWSFLIAGETMAEYNFIPPWLAMWSPNIVVGAFGIWMTVSMLMEKGIAESTLYNVIYRIAILLRSGKIG